MHERDEAAGRHMIECRDFADIGAADKGTLTGTADHHQPELRIATQPGDGADDLGHQLSVEAVQFGAVVYRHMRNPASFRPILAPHQDTHRAKSPAPTRQ